MPDYGAWMIAGMFALDRGLKLLAVQRFLRRPLPPAPETWPSVTLLQPITRGASDLPGALACRAALQYKGSIQHLLICDAADKASEELCRHWIQVHPHLDACLLALPGAPADTPPGSAPQRTAQGAERIASKVEKLQVALPYAHGEVLAFVDDDILLRPAAVAGLVRHLQQERTGAAFGLAAYTNWSNTPSSLLSAFVNANALLSYLPLTYLADPFTITGHFYALRRPVFDAIGGLGGMRGRFDDDHELARRVMQHGLRNVQTAVIYDVDNYLATIDDYANQMHRWFAIPRQTMAPYLSARQQVVSLVGSVGSLLPPLLGAIALLRVLTVPFRPKRRAPDAAAPGSHSPQGKLRRKGWPPHLALPASRLAPLLSVLALHAAVYAICTHNYLHRRTPWRRGPLIFLSALLAPLQALGGLLGPATFRWRGQQIRLQRGGKYDIL
jgi:ceramide glucosyltransferase